MTDPTGHYDDPGHGGGGGGPCYDAPLGDGGNGGGGGCAPTAMDGDSGVQGTEGAANTMTFIASLIPLVGDFIDVYDISAALIEGDFNEAGIIAALALAPGSARAIRQAGGAASAFLKQGSMSDEAYELFLKRVDEVVDALCSFSADTLVMTIVGLKPISEVAAGELVLAYNEKTGEISYYPVIASWVHTDPIIVHLTIDGETIQTTPDHPFYVENGKWVRADELQIGDELRNATWETNTIEAIHVTYLPQAMYNFSVAEAHTYFVGESQWLVHNDCGKVALGKTSHLDDFKKGKDWSDWRILEDEYRESRTTDVFEWLPMMLRDAKELHFNTTGLGSWQEAFAKGYYGGGITEWELHYILTNRQLYDKTTFYDEYGNVIDIPFQGDN